MEMKTLIQANACSYWGTVAVKSLDVEPLLQEMWLNRAANHIRDMVVNAGQSRSEVEDIHQITDMYQPLWKRLLWEAVEEHSSKKLCYLAECGAVRDGEYYLIKGEFFFEPEVTINSDVMEIVESVRICSESVVSMQMIEEHIAVLRDRVRYSDENLITVVDSNVFQDGDVAVLKIRQQQKEMKASIAVVVLGDKCPAHVKEAVIGRKPGDNIIFTDVQNTPQGPRSVQISARIDKKVRAPEIDDASLLKKLKVPDYKIFVDSIKKSIVKQSEETYQNRLMEKFAEVVSIGPIPAMWVWDRAEGYFAHLLSKENGNQHKVLHAMGKESKDEAVHSLLPNSKQQIVRELLLKSVAAVLGLDITDEMVLERAKEAGVSVEDPQTKYITLGVLTSELVLSSCAKRVTDERRIILPEEPRTAGGIILAG